MPKSNKRLSALLSGTRKVLEKIYARKRAQINQPIFIQDLIATTRDGWHSSLGEYYRSNGPAEDMLLRLSTHIKFLFDFTNAHHIKQNYVPIDAEHNTQIPPKLKLKPGHENHITRLSTPELHFYTAKPLTQPEYTDLYSKIAEMAEKLSPNVHLLLSSFSVIHNLDTVLNIALYVEGGRPAKMHHFAKNTASEVDEMYDLDNFTQQVVQEEPSHHAEIVGYNAVTPQPGIKTVAPVTTGNVFTVKTAGGAEYTQVVEICLDHTFKHGKEQVAQMMRFNHHLISDHVDQIVTSNVILALHEDNTLTEHVLHADQTVYSAASRQLSPQEFSDYALSDGNLAEFMPFDSNPNMIVHRNELTYSVENPVFGYQYEIAVYTNRALSGYKPDMAKQLEIHNKHVFNLAIVNACNGHKAQIINSLFKHANPKLAITDTKPHDSRDISL